MFLINTQILLMIGGAVVAPILLSICSLLLIIIWTIVIIFLHITKQKITPPQFLIWFTNAICFFSVILSLILFLCPLFLERIDEHRYNLADLKPDTYK